MPSHSLNMDLYLYVWGYLLVEGLFVFIGFKVCKVGKDGK